MTSVSDPEPKTVEACSHQGPLKPTSERPKVFTPLDAARGLAALAVVAFHLRFSDSVKESLPYIHAIAKHGYLGVPLFFVISGFCLAASAASSRRKDESVLSFRKRRFRRIYPPLWCSMIVVAALPWLKWGVLKTLGSKTEWPTPLFINFDGWDWIATGTLLQAFRFGDMPLDDKFGNFNVVYWSLAIEVQFYIVMALALAWRQFYYPILLCVTALRICSVQVDALKFLNWNSGSFLPMWSMFAIGIVLYEARSRDWTASRWLPSNIAAIFGTTGLLIAAANTINGIAADRPASGVVFALTCALAFWFCIPLEDWLRIPGRKPVKTLIQYLFKPLTWLGTISYSVYLLHFNLHKMPNMILEKVAPVDAVWVQLFVISIVCGMCYPFYLLCEKPFIAVRRAAASKALDTAPSPNSLS